MWSLVNAIGTNSKFFLPRFTKFSIASSVWGPSQAEGPTCNNKAVKKYFYIGTKIMLYIVVPFSSRITCSWKFFTKYNKNSEDWHIWVKDIAIHIRVAHNSWWLDVWVSVETTPETCLACQNFFIVCSEIHKWGQNHPLYLLVKWKLWYDPRGLHTPITSAEFFCKFSKWPTIREEHWTMTATTIITHILLFFDDAIWQRSKIS